MMTSLLIAARVALAEQISSDVEPNLAKDGRSEEIMMETQHRAVGKMILKSSGENRVKGTTMNGGRSRRNLWFIRAMTTILLWTCIVQLTAIGDSWGPRMLKGWPSCLTSPRFPLLNVSFNPPVADEEKLPILPPQRIYRNNGYLMVSCNGGLNQMRAAICDMVTIARYLNVTLIVPELDKTSFWADPSDFQDIFDVDYFIRSLRDEVRIVKELPPGMKIRAQQGMLLSMPPISWSNMSYYLNQVLPLIKKNKILHFNKTDARLANNGLPLEAQKLRCRVNYSALKFTPKIEELGKRVLSILRSKGPFLVLHLRYEMDMLAFSGCSHGCREEEAEELTRLRYAYPWWKEKVIDSVQKRKDGLCPLTPEETVLALKALGIDQNLQIYIAAGEIYGGQRRMDSILSSYPNLVRKEALLDPSELMPIKNHSTQMAALDYMVSLESDIFFPTYDGNMAKVVEGHRRYLGSRKTIVLNRRMLVEAVDKLEIGVFNWEEFAEEVKAAAAADQVGSPPRRVVIPNFPKNEDYFYANPYECLPDSPQNRKYN